MNKQTGKTPHQKGKKQKLMRRLKNEFTPTNRANSFSTAQQGFTKKYNWVFS